MDVSRFSRRLVLANTQTNTQPTTQEVESGESCQCPRNAKGVTATGTPAVSVATAPPSMEADMTRAKDNSSP